jgi:hypothetical protein
MGNVRSDSCTEDIFPLEIEPKDDDKENEQYTWSEAIININSSSEIQPLNTSV